MIGYFPIKLNIYIVDECRKPPIFNTAKVEMDVFELWEIICVGREREGDNAPSNDALSGIAIIDNRL